jgi:hypothetical protein
MTDPLISAIRVCEGEGAQNSDMEKHQGRRPSNEELVAEAYRLIAESKCLVAERRRLLEMTRVIAARMEGSKSQQG